MVKESGTGISDRCIWKKNWRRGGSRNSVSFSCRGSSGVGGNKLVVDTSGGELEEKVLGRNKWS